MYSIIKFFVSKVILILIVLTLGGCGFEKVPAGIFAPSPSGSTWACMAVPPASTGVNILEAEEYIFSYPLQDGIPVCLWEKEQVCDTP